MWTTVAEFFLGKPKQPDEFSERANENWVRLLRIILAISALAVLLMGSRYSTEGGLDITKGLLGLMVAGSALFVGGLLGFLFGIPRAQTGQAALVQSGENNDDIRQSYNENTNLEQISDWLTKIIVGVSLIQFNAIFDSVGGFAAKIGPAFLPETPAEAAGPLAMAFLIFFTIHGFFFSYMWTRVYMIRVLKRANRPILLEIKSATEEQARVDARALSIVAEHLDYGDESPQVDEAHMKELVAKASEPVQTQIFLMAREFRKAQTKAESEKMMVRCVPVFEALIGASREGFHRYHAQLGYGLLNIAEPDLEAVKKHMRQAIALRDRDGVRGYELYEMILADIVVMQDADFAAGKKSGADVGVQVGLLIEKGTNLYAIEKFPRLMKWRKLNKRD